jgi:Uncharacterized protein conserved in bacteria
MENSVETIQMIEKYCLNQLGAYETRPFGTYPICYRVMGKIFAQLNPEEHFYKMTLKCEPEKAYVYRQLYPEVIVRGYHCPPVQQPYWNTINLDTFSDIELLFQMIDEAYVAVVEKFSKKAKNRLLTISELEFKYTDETDPDYKMFCNKLDSSLDEVLGGRFQRDSSDTFGKNNSIYDVMVAYQNGKPVACGAFQMYDEDHAELGCLFTLPSNQKMGLGTEIIRRLEARAKIKGFKWCVLAMEETLEAACYLFKKAGYKIMPNYGQYADIPNLICMERKI